MSEQNGEQKQPNAKAMRMVEVFTKKTPAPGKSALLAKMKAFEKKQSNEPEPDANKKKLPPKLRTSASKKLWDEVPSSNSKTSTTPPSPSKTKIGFKMPPQQETQSDQSNKKTPTNTIQKEEVTSSTMEEKVSEPPSQSLSSDPIDNTGSGGGGGSEQNEEESGGSGSGNSGHSDALEAIEMARQAMGNVASSASLMDNSASNQQLPPPNILRKNNSGNEQSNKNKPLVQLDDLDDDNNDPPPPPSAPPQSDSITSRSPSVTRDEFLKSPVDSTRKLSGLSRFKKAGTTVKIVQSFSSGNSVDKPPSSTSTSASASLSAADRNRTSSSPNRASAVFRPSLKAGQQAILEIERKQWLAKKQQQEAAERMLDIKLAQEKACLKTGDMNLAMAKLNSILSPNYQSPDIIHEMEMKADGVLKRIKDQLQEAALGGDYDNEDQGNNYDDNGDDSHQKNAVRGKELILRLARNAPTKVRKDSNDEEDDDEDENDDDEDENDDEDEVKKESLFGSEGMMKWAGPITVDRLTDDAEEMANNRGLSGQKATYESLCSVLIIDGLGNVAANGWEEKFLSLSDSKLWAAAYFSVEGGTISTLGHAGQFTCVADLRSPGVSVVFEECSHTSTGFCIAMRTLSAFTIKLAPKRYKVLLEWGAALSQAINELPSLVEIPTAAGHPELSAHGGLYHARPSVAYGVLSNNQAQDYNYYTNFSNVKNLNSGPSSVAGSEVSVTDKNWVESYRRQKAMRRGGGNNM